MHGLKVSYACLTQPYMQVLITWKSVNLLLIMASVYLSTVCCQLLLFFGLGSAFDPIVYNPVELKFEV